VLLNQRALDVRAMLLGHVAEYRSYVKAERQRSFVASAPSGGGIAKPALAIFGNAEIPKLGQGQPLALPAPLLDTQLVLKFARLLFGGAEITMADSGGVVESTTRMPSLRPVPG
jgi:hypothetical protein